MTRIRTDRLLLRPARPADTGALHAVFSDARAMAYWSTPPHTDIRQTADFIARMIATPNEQGEEFVVVLGGTVIGKAGFWQLPEIGFIFAPRVWGQGVAAEAVSALIDHGFHARGLRRIEADVDPRNLHALRLLEKLGFRETGRAANTLKVGETWCDSVYLTLVPDRT